MANITILEDYLPLARLMADFLRSRGHRVNTATNAFDGLARIKEGSPDIVLVDLALGNDDGIGVIKRAKASGARCKFLVVTGSTEVRHVVAAMKVGAEDYCTKPFKLEVLHESIEDCLADKGAPAGEAAPPVGRIEILAALPETPPAMPTAAPLVAKATSVANDRRWWHTLTDREGPASGEHRPASTRLVVLRDQAATG
jgi:DNA-binding response OmpR family regulator